MREDRENVTKENTEGNEVASENHRSTNEQTLVRVDVEDLTQVVDVGVEEDEEEEEEEYY